MSPEEIKKLYLKYLQAKIALEDWHAVQDMAVDLQVLETKYPELRSPTKLT